MRRIIVAIAAQCFLNTSVFAADRGSDASAIAVARVGGEVFVYADIAITRDQLSKALKHRSPGASIEANPDMARTLQMELEVRRLASLIRGAIRDAALKRLGIIPTDAEIAERCERDYPREKRKRLAILERKTIEALVAAYEAVLRENKMPDEVYDNLLANVISREAWNDRLKYDVTEVSLKKLRAVLDSDIDERFDCKTSMRLVIVMEREGPAIDKEIARLNAEYADYLRLAAEDPRSPTLRDKGPMYRQARRYQWWQEQYNKADITILDPRFAQVPDKVRNGR